jgi:TolA-binding protein
VPGRTAFIVLILSALFSCSLYALTDVTAVSGTQDTVGIDEQNAARAEAFGLAVQLFNDREYRLALDHFRAIIESHPSSPQGIESRYYLGLIYRQIGQDENARMTLQTFALTFPDHGKAPEAWRNVADIFASQNRFADAGATIERLVQFHPDHPIVPDAMLDAGTYFEKAGEPQKAEEFLRRIILHHGTSDAVIPARIEYGRYRLRAGRYEEASAVFERAVSDIPDNPRDSSIVELKAAAILGRAESLHNRRLYDGADREYLRVIEQHQGTAVLPQALLGRAEMFRQQGLHLEAVDMFRRAQQSTANSRDETMQQIGRRAMLGIAGSYMALGDYSSAATFYDLYARQFAANASRRELLLIWRGAAISNEGMGNYQRSIEWWERIADLDVPADQKEEAFIRSAINYYEQGDYTGAAERLRRYTELYRTPETAEGLYRLGSILEEHLNDHRRALAAYEELTYRFPESAFVDDAVLGQARMHLKIGNDANAYHIVGEFPERFPGSSLLPDVKTLRHELEVYHLLDRDQGFQRITSLMSEMIAGAPRGELAYQLGEIYLNQLKQYPEAARQFETALSLDLPQDKRNQAEYLLAHSLYRMADRSQERRSEALAKLRDLRDGSPRSPNNEIISYYYVTVLRRVAGPAEFINAAEQFVETHRRSGHVPDVLFALAQAKESIGEAADALGHYRQIYQSHQNAPVAADALMRIADFQLESGAETEALATLSTYRQRYPRGDRIADAVIRAAEIRVRNASFPEAADLYSTFVQRYPYHDRIDDARIGLAHAFFETGRYGDSHDLLEDILIRYERSYFSPQEIPDNLMYRAAHAAYRGGRIDRAIELYEEYLTRDRESIDAGIASIMLGELFRERGNIHLSDYHYARSSEILAGGTESRDVADLLYNNRQYQRAVPHLTRVADAATDEQIKKTYRARTIFALLRSGSLNEARPRIESFRRDYPEERDEAIEFEYEIALHEFRSRSYDPAARSFQQFIQQHGRHARTPFAHFYLGRTWEAVGRLQDARKKYEEVFQQYPDAGVIPDVHLAYAGLLLRQENFIEAIDHYRIILETAPDNDDVMYYALQNIAQAYEEIGFFEAALEYTETFIERFPGDPAVINKHVRIGSLYQRAGLHERAIEKFQSLMLYADRPLETELRYYAGDSFHSMGSFRRAIREFQTVTEIDPRTSQLDWTATALYMAGQSYEQLGDATEAIAMYQSIINHRNIEAQYKAAARREIERVRGAMRQTN